MSKPKPVERVEKLSVGAARKVQEQTMQGILKSKKANTKSIRSGAVQVELTDKEING